MHDESSDRELLYWLPDDHTAFEVFYRRHVDRVIGFAARRMRDPADVADVVASTFVTVLSAARSYDPERGAPTAWLLGITARLIANGARRSNRETALVARIAGRRLLDPDDVERLVDRIDADQDAAAVRDAIEHLKPKAREVLLLVGVDGLTSAEAAQVLGISGPNFRMRLSSARRALAGVLRSPPDGAGPHPERPTPSPRAVPHSPPTLKEVPL